MYYKLIREWNTIIIVYSNYAIMHNRYSRIGNLESKFNNAKICEKIKVIVDWNIVKKMLSYIIAIIFSIFIS